MGLLLLIGLGLLIFLIVAVNWSNDDIEEETCREDVPCIECGRCFDNHDGPFTGHSYTTRWGS